VTSTGWTLDYIDTLTLPEANELMQHWLTYPPAHAVLAARYLKQPGGKKKVSKDEQVQELSLLMGVEPQKMPEDLAQAIAWAESMKKEKKMN
jgi:hypothetical protein